MCVSCVCSVRCNVLIHFHLTCDPGIRATPSHIDIHGASSCDSAVCLASTISETGEMKYIVVSGGVVSGLGKGISISSIGVLLKASGLRVTSIKIDPYLNSDAGTMSPFEVSMRQ